ncbi:hypothetical protein EMIHUDRAFT_259595 [Emiliania huxleyi CCMP1516]|uniref:Secreted protein n=2 Tax=Emiliania huxleyi TaxID=2903 RepID=A0A0D3HZM2_EMIH1|nr:hypothetical protein EMIHUDRAFT_259595 [Emiliania huxleyi CCMP1516]EOD04457.1 hypothetical protein EMIHUDRAFT_259595 [Emiliania huxleyi CCMP1516]|eukprot:XP_005756886.1 hypothetical protein EMIHUDRAFT_259595 [Emiliania huxleyi CCMP1516]
MSRIRLANTILKFIYIMKIPTCPIIWALLALALALSITALPPPSRADVGQPDHDNASAAGLQLEAPLNEHESRCTTAARVMQPKGCGVWASSQINFPHQPADQRSSVAVCDQGQW